MVQTQFHEKKIEVFISDNEQEYFNKVLGQFFSKNYIIYQNSCNDTPSTKWSSQNKKNKHILEVARALLFTNNVPKYLWGQKVTTTTYLVNRMP